MDLSTEFVKFTYDETTEKITLSQNGGPPGLTIRFQLSKDLYIKLGFGLTADQRVWVRTNTTAEFTADLDVGHSSIFIYSDILSKNRVVGNEISDLLAVIPFVGKHNTISHFSPKIIEYRDVRFGVIDEILISLRGDISK